MDWFWIEPRKIPFVFNVVLTRNSKLVEYLCRKIFIFMFYLLNMMQYFIFNKCLCTQQELFFPISIFCSPFILLLPRWGEIDAAQANNFDIVNHCIFNAQSVLMKYCQTQMTNMQTFRMISIRSRFLGASLWWHKYFFPQLSVEEKTNCFSFLSRTAHATDRWSDGDVSAIKPRKLKRRKRRGKNKQRKN